MKRYDEASGFWLTPHKVSQCILVGCYVAPGNGSQPFRMLPPSIRHRLGLFILYLTKASSGFAEPSLEELGRQLKDGLEVGEELATWLGRRLRSFTSPEDLFTFFLTLKDLLAPVPYVNPEESGDAEKTVMPVEHSSSLGQFLRRCILSFNLLTFEGICRILTEIDAYRQPVLHSEGQGLQEATVNVRVYEEDDIVEDDSESDLGVQDMQRAGAVVSGTAIFPLNRQRQLAETGSGGSEDSAEAGQEEGLTYAFGAFADRGDVTGNGKFLRTHGQIEAYLKSQAAAIERELGGISNQTYDRQLTLLEKLAPGIPRVHYLRYLGYLHRGDYSAALDSIHRYYDYSAGRGGVMGGTSSDASHGRFQAGLLGLGSMHAHLGHVSQGLQALNEAVHIAQQHNDDECLAHALAASYHLLAEAGFTSLGTPHQWPSITVGATALGLNGGHGPGSAIQQQILLVIRRCLQRALELKLPHLVAFSRLALSKFDVKSLRSSSWGLNESPTSIFGVPTTTKLGSHRPKAGLSSSFTAQIFNPPANTLGTGAGWSTLMARVGHPTGSILKSAGTSHLLRAASWEVYGSSSLVRVCSLVHATCYSNVASEDDHALSYIKLAQHLATFKGYKVALSALEVAASKFGQSAKSRVRAVQLELLHEQALNRGEIRSAEIACGELFALTSSVLGVNMDTKIAATYQHIRSLVAAGRLVEAAVPLQVLFSLCCKANMQIDCIPLLLLMANMYKEAGAAVSGIPYVLASLTLSQAYGQDLLHASAFVTLAELWLGLGVDHAQQALSLLEHCLPMVRGHGGIHLRARANLAIARCYLSSASFSVLAQPDTVFDPLLEAAKDFDLLECHASAAEAHYLLALLFNSFNQLHERDKSAAAYRRCILNLSSAQDYKI